MKYVNPRLVDLVQKHEAQIAALTEPGLDDAERIRRFGEAAGFDEGAFKGVRSYAFEDGESVAYAVWNIGYCPASLFADLPGCKCPVIEVAVGRKSFFGIPSDIPYDWQPTVEVLRRFAEVQQEARA